MAFLDLEKAYDRVPREVVYWCLRRRGTPEELLRWSKQHMREQRQESEGHMEKQEFAIQVGVHQGSALSPFLSIVVMDTLVNEIKSEIPWELIFADDSALMAETEEKYRKGVEMAGSI